MQPLENIPSDSSIALFEFSQNPTAAKLCLCWSFGGSLKTGFTVNLVVNFTESPESCLPNGFGRSNAFSHIFIFLESHAVPSQPASLVPPHLYPVLTLYGDQFTLPSVKGRRIIHTSRGVLRDQRRGQRKERLCLTKHCWKLLLLYCLKKRTEFHLLCALQPFRLQKHTVFTSF